MGRSIEIEINTADKSETGPVLRRGQLDQLRWFAENKPYRVKFDVDGSPFGTDEFVVKRKGPTDSGPVRSDAEFREYHYRIYDLNAPGGKAVDPKVIIKP